MAAIMQSATIISVKEKWAAVVEREYPRLLRYARRLAYANHDDAEDMVQEAACRILDSRVDPTVVQSQVSYLRTVIRNVWLDERRKRPMITVSYDDDANEGIRIQLVDEQASNVMQSRIEDRELTDIFGRLLREELGYLQKREHKLLLMHLQGLNTMEIAEELGEDVRVVRYNLNAIKSRMRYRLKRRAGRVGYDGHRGDRCGVASSAFISGGVKSKNWQLRSNTLHEGSAASAW